MSRINGKSFDVRLMGFKVHVESFTLDIEDNSTVAKNKGRPNGRLLGDVAASGEIVVDTANLMLIMEAARAAGSFQQLPVFPIDAYAAGLNGAKSEVMHVHAHDCALRISSLLDIDPESTDKTQHTLPYDVTGEDFVYINGVPYLETDELSLL